MRIAVIGAGGVGGYFGARLAAAGEDVRFIARGAHLEAIRRDGLKVDSTASPLTVKVRAAADPAELGPGPYDLVMIAVKLWGTTDAIETARKLMTPGTAVVSFQNGVDGIPTLVKAFGHDAVLGGVAHVSTHISAPGVVHQTGAFQRLTVGEPSGGLSARVTAFVDAAKRAGINAIAAEDIHAAIWDKFVFLATFSGVCTLSRQDKAHVFGDPDLRKIFDEALAEAVAVGRAQGVQMPQDQYEKTLAFGVSLPETMKPSLLHDFEAGNRLEVEFLSGAVARLGAASGVPTPIHRTIYAALKPFAAGRRA
jgi:2-dehydropantoate 2-reductase